MRLTTESSIVATLTFSKDRSFHSKLGLWLTAEVKSSKASNFERLAVWGFAGWTQVESSKGINGSRVRKMRRFGCSKV